ncbi:MAG: hypothetical protein R3F17_14165 [Planctomycetota bacterium]
MQSKNQGNLELAKAELRDRIERARLRLPETVERVQVWANDDGEPPSSCSSSWWTRRWTTEVS